MAFDSQSLSGSIAVQKFNLAFLTATGSPSSPLVVIQYKATGPASVTDDLTTYEYSTDGGTTYNTMTLTTPAEASDITVSETGTINQFTWAGYTDLGLNLFGSSITIRLASTDSTHTTPYMISTFVIEKVLSTPESRTGDQIKKPTHVGVPGASLVKELFNPSV